MKSAETSVISRILTRLRCIVSGCIFIFFLSSISVFAEEGTAAFDVAAETPYDAHGKLSVVSTYLTDSSGEIFQLRGVSSNTPLLLTSDTFRRLRDSWKINTIRLTVSPDGDNGYLALDEAGRLAYQEHLVTLAKDAYDLGLYVIVDWHTPAGSDPNNNKETAVSFLGNLSLLLQDYNNILYEICSPSSAEITWEQIYSYALTVIDAIRMNTPESVIIVGAPDNLQNLESALSLQVPRSNLLYSFQLSISPDMNTKRDFLQTALQNNLPLILSQFSISHEYEDSSVLLMNELQSWINFLEQHGIGHILSNFSNIDHPDSLLKPGSVLSDHHEEELYGAAINYRFLLTTDDWRYTVSSLFDESFPVHWELNNGCRAEVIENTNWYGNPAYCEYLVTLINPTDSDFSNWRIRFTWNQEILSVPEYWNCEIGSSGSSRLVISKEYNTVVPAGTSVCFGLVVAGSASPKLISVEIE